MKANNPTKRVNRLILHVFAVVFVVGATRSAAQERAPLLPEPVISALAKELSGERAYETIVAISRNHRVRGSRPFRAAAEYIARRAREAGLEDVRIEEFPADGKICYGTQRSRPPWDAEFAELWEMRRGGNRWIPKRLLTSWAKQTMSVAEDSESGDVTAELIDVGPGDSEPAYAGKNVSGKLILVSSQPAAAVPRGIARLHAAGIVSYAQNQHTGWWGDNAELVRWGHLDTFSPTKTFAFMISPAIAKSFRDRIAGGEHVTLHATVRAGQHPGAYQVVTAAIRGADTALSREEIVFSCHLDHPNPGANDNASGCATILEVGITLAKLIREGRIPRPARTIRFVWPPEVEGTMAMLNSKPDWADRIRAVVHMDMVGGGPDTKAVFHVSSGPASVPSFVYDVAQSFGAFVNDQSYRFAATGSASYPLVAPKGGKEALLAALDEFDMGSDHEIYADASWGIPAIYLHDWPDRYIHTTWDTPARIDPTKLLRAAFIGAASGYFLATFVATDTARVRYVIEGGTVRRSARMHDRLDGLSVREATNLRAFTESYEMQVKSSADWYLPHRTITSPESARVVEGGSITTDSTALFRLNPAIKGPMTVFGYSYLADKLGADRAAALKLLQYDGLRGAGADYAYQLRNLLRSPRRVIDVRNALSAIYGPVPTDIVLEYMKALEEIGVVRRER